VRRLVGGCGSKEALEKEIARRKQGKEALQDHDEIQQIRLRLAREEKARAAREQAKALADIVCAALRRVTDVLTLPCSGPKYKRRRSAALSASNHSSFP